MGLRKIICTLLFAVPAISLLGAKQKSSSVKLAWENLPRTIDPRFTTDANSHYLSDLTNCSLINFGETGQIVGELASSWDWVDGKTLKMTMRMDGTFSNGEKVTPEDVKATYDFFKQEGLKKASPLAGAFKNIASIEIDKNVLLFKFIEPDTSFVQNLMIGIVPKAQAGNEMFDKPQQYNGCGPFILTSMNVSGLILSKNPKYSLGKPSTIDRIEIKVVKDELTRFSKLRKGEVDLVQDNISRDKVPEIAKKYPILQVTKRPGLNTTYLGFNMKDKFVSNPKVRRAIGMAIKKDEIIKYIFKDMAVPATTMLTPQDPYLNETIPAIAFDVAGAKKLLDEAGYKDPDGDGKQPRFTLSYKTTTNVTRITIAQAIAAQLKKIGIHVKVESLEWGKFKSDIEAGRVQMWSLSWVGFKDPDIYRYAFASESFPPNGGNRGWYKNDALDKILQEAKVTPQVEKRKKLYFQAQEIIAADLPYIFLWHEESFAVHNKRLSGFKLYADGRLSSLAQVKVK